MGLGNEDSLFGEMLLSLTSSGQGWEPHSTHPGLLMGRGNELPFSVSLNTTRTFESGQGIQFGCAIFFLKGTWTDNVSFAVKNREH